MINNNNNIVNTLVITRVNRIDLGVKEENFLNFFLFQSRCCETHVAERFENDLLESEKSEHDARFP